MPVLRNSKHEQFAQHVAAGKTYTTAYILSGYPEKAAATCASRLAKKSAVAARIAEVQAKISSGLERISIRKTEHRLSRQQDRWDRLQQVIDERATAPEFQQVAGGKTGLLVRKLKQIGSGDSAKLVEEFEVDTGLLAEARKHEEHAARELGQWTSPETNVSVTAVVVLPSPAATRPAADVGSEPRQLGTGEVIDITTAAEIDASR